MSITTKLTSENASKAQQDIPLLIPDMPTTDELIPWLRQIDSNLHYSNYGPLNTLLEHKLLEYFAHPSLHLTTVANATLGIELALQVLGLPKGATVLVPATTFVATGTAILRAGFTPLFADIDEESWLLTPDIARSVLKKHAFAAVIPVASFGTPQDTKAWDAFSREHHIPVIIDAAGAFGNQHPATECLTIFSLHATKAMGAGEGGFIVSASHDQIQKLRRLANFGLDSASGVSQEAGTNAKLSEYHAAVALASLQRWSKIRDARKSLLQNYQKLLSTLSAEFLFQKGSLDNITTLFVLRLLRDDINPVISFLRTAGIGTRRWYYPPLYEQPTFTSYPRAGALANTALIAPQLLGLPFYNRLTAAQLARVVDCLEKSLK